MVFLMLTLVGKGQTSARQTIRLDEGWKSFFKLKKTKGIENPKPPYYKKDGYHMNVKYLNNSFKIMDTLMPLPPK